MKPLILGINPSAVAFRKNHSLYRLATWMTFLGYDTYCFSNVIPHEGNYSHKDVDLDFVRESTQGHDTILALGGFVSKVLQRAHIDHITLPHPSPLNRNLNDKKYEKSMLEDLRNNIS
mgnify:FL=1|tara:strand:+ start:26 stop:379 length:354 start_codon:yes stop_codon:yes gene_type:complete